MQDASQHLAKKDGASITPARAKVAQLETGRTVTSSRVSGPRAAVGGFPYPGHRTVAEIDALGRNINLSLGRNPQAGAGRGTIPARADDFNRIHDEVSA